MARRVPALLAAVLLAAALPLGAQAEEGKLKIGFMATLSGPPAALGQHMRDGFQLGVKELGGKLGGLPTEVVVDVSGWFSSGLESAAGRLVDTRED